VSGTRWGIVLGAFFLAYPLLVYFGLTYFEPRIIALMLVVLAIGRFAVAKPGGIGRGLAPQLLLALAVAVVVGFLALLTNSSHYLRFYPVCMNVLMFVLFFSSLFRPPSMIERFARITEPDLSEAGMTYTRNVTKVWCGFFLFNGAIAFYTSVSASMEIWALYNGAISYALIALLFAGEYLFRLWWRHRGPL
jgi:uncharacterized membrane protein